MSVVKNILKMSPKEEQDGAFSPSPVALKLATESKTDYDFSEYPNAVASGKYKILMVCTEQRNMTMKNGKKFSTGNHPVEMLVPMLHLEKAGFDIDIFTPTGESAKIEMWAMPEKDQAVKEIYEKYQSQFENPKSLRDFVQADMPDAESYVAVFLPGGHGAMLGLPDNTDLEQVIDWVDEKEKFMLSICHGPAALLAASIGKKEVDFVYRGYKMAVFPDLMDQMTPLFGYMPGAVPWKFGEKLKELGVQIVNKNADKTCIQDRRLITGASPKAANNFGKMAAKALLNDLA